MAKYQVFLRDGGAMGTESTKSVLVEADSCYATETLSFHEDSDAARKTVAAFAPGSWSHFIKMEEKCNG